MPISCKQLSARNSQLLGHVSSDCIAGDTSHTAFGSHNFSYAVQVPKPLLQACQLGLHGAPFRPQLVHISPQLLHLGAQRLHLQAQLNRPSGHLLWR